MNGGRSRNPPVPEREGGFLSSHAAEDFHSRPACPAGSGHVDIPDSGFEQASDDLRRETRSDFLHDDRDREFADKEANSLEHTPESRVSFRLEEFLEGIQMHSESVGVHQRRQLSD